MTDQDQRFIEAVRRLYGGDDAERAALAPDIVWHVPGHNPVSGDYHGLQAYTQLMPARMAPLTCWDFQLEDVMVNGHRVVTRITMQGERKGHMVALRGAHILRLNDQAQIVEGWGFVSDQDALDAFFSA